MRHDERPADRSRFAGGSEKDRNPSVADRVLMVFFAILFVSVVVWVAWRAAYGW